MKKPIIGLVPLYDEKKESYWMLPGYMQGIEKAGGIAVMLPLTEDENTLNTLIEKIDGLLLTGGHDVSPTLYGEEKLDVCAKTCPERDNMEKHIVLAAIKADKPIFGICRGIQLLNALLGGTLYQDLPAQFPSDICHRQNPPYDEPAHRVSLEEGTPLYTLFGKDSLNVNSCHHQGIKNLAPGLRAMAYAPDGLTEAVYMPDKKFVWAVQWHPEFAYKTDRDSLELLKRFVKAAE